MNICPFRIAAIPTDAVRYVLQRPKTLPKCVESLYIEMRLDLWRTGICILIEDGEGAIVLDSHTP
jgi:hypothetical protein